jgi:hypothetical protein
MDFTRILKPVFASDALLFASFASTQLQCAPDVKMDILENSKAQAASTNARLGCMVTMPGNFVLQSLQ